MGLGGKPTSQPTNKTSAALVDFDILNDIRSVAVNIERTNQTVVHKLCIRNPLTVAPCASVTCAAGYFW